MFDTNKVFMSKTYCTEIMRWEDVPIGATFFMTRLGNMFPNQPHIKESHNSYSCSTVPNGVTWNKPPDVGVFIDPKQDGVPAHKVSYWNFVPDGTRYRLTSGSEKAYISDEVYTKGENDNHNKWKQILVEE